MSTIATLKHKIAEIQILSKEDGPKMAIVSLGAIFDINMCNFDYGNEMQRTAVEDCTQTMKERVILILADYENRFRKPLNFEKMKADTVRTFENIVKTLEASIPNP